jgi:hypothetical protein
MPVELHTTPVTSRWQGDPSGVGFAQPPSPCLRKHLSDPVQQHLQPAQQHTVGQHLRGAIWGTGIPLPNPPSPCPRNSTSVTQCSSARNLLSSTQRGSKRWGWRRGGWQGDPSRVGFAHPPSPCPRNSTSVTQCSSTPHCCIFVTTALTVHRYHH